MPDNPDPINDGPYLGDPPGSLEILRAELLDERDRLRGVIARAAEELASLDDDAVGWLESFPFLDQPARRTATTILRARAILAEGGEEDHG